MRSRESRVEAAGLAGSVAGRTPLPCRSLAGAAELVARMVGASFPVEDLGRNTLRDLEQLPAEPIRVESQIVELGRLRVRDARLACVAVDGVVPVDGVSYVGDVDQRELASLAWERQQFTSKAEEDLEILVALEGLWPSGERTATDCRNPAEVALGASWLASHRTGGGSQVSPQVRPSISRPSR